MSSFNLVSVEEREESFLYNSSLTYLYMQLCAQLVVSKGCANKAMVLKPRPIPMPAETGYFWPRGRGGSLDCMWGVQTHSGPGQDEWHSTTKSQMTARNRTWISRSRVTTLNHQTIPDSLQHTVSSLFDLKVVCKWSVCSNQGVHSLFKLCVNGLLQELSALWQCGDNS